MTLATESRRASSLPRALGWTALSALLPGAGHVRSGRRWGYAVLVLTLGGAVAAAVYVGDLDRAVDLVLDPARLRVAAAVALAVLLLWVAVVVSTYLLLRPRDLGRSRSALGGAALVVLCLLLASPVALGARYAMVQADLVDDVFRDNRTATVPRQVTAEDPWGGQRRVNVLLLGGDGSVTRDGLRTDSMILLSADTRTGDAVMFGLPRNMMGAEFPAGSPLHDLYPEGFTSDVDPAAAMLNAVYGQVPALHPGVLGRSDNEGADAVKQAVEGTLGIPVHYYVLANLRGFQEIVDALGGVTVNVNEPVAINGSTDRGIPPTDYLDPGPDRRLNGFQALWFARGRWGSDDYERMLRQRCMVQAIIDEADPLTVLRRYQALVAAGKEIVRTDIPADLLPAFVDLALEVKGADVRSVTFVRSDAFHPEDPDLDWVRAQVDRALVPPVRRERGEPADEVPPSTSPADPDGEQPQGGEDEDAGAAVDVADSCAYDPDGWDTDGS
jgi:polyisoprenyl-teichoic acid--peptidoglycan teichoic acid transferase